MTKHFYETNEIQHKCLKISGFNLINHTGNGDIKVNFWIVICFCIQQMNIYLQLLNCKTQARVGTLFEKDTFDQLGCLQDYPRQIIFIKQLSIPVLLQKMSEYHLLEQHSLFYKPKLI